MKEIYFIRHGESEANAGLATHLPETIALTALGIEQSKQVASIFETAPELIVMSPYLRTQQTAEPTIEKFSEARVEEWNVQEFTYLSLAKYADTTMKFREPFVKAYWDKCETGYCDGDGSESFAAFIARVQNLIEKISAAKETIIAVFTHGQFIKAIIWLLINGKLEINNASMRAYYNFLYAVNVPNASVFKIFVGEFADDVQLSGISTKHLPNKLIS